MHALAEKNPIIRPVTKLAGDEAKGAKETSIVTNKHIFEPSADRMANQVTYTSERQLQRACPCGGGCPKCHTEQLGADYQSLQTKRVQASAPGQIPAPPIVHEVLRSPGLPLDSGTRAFMEPRFGYDFSRVRVHADARAAESSRAVNALAYTVGNNVVFGAHQYAPNTQRGRELLAHELTHTIQQQSAIGAPPSSDVHGILESSADAAGRSVASGGTVQPNLPTCGIGLARAPAFPDDFDEDELARRLHEVIERLKQPEYSGRDRDLAIKKLLLAVSNMEEKADESEPVLVTSMDTSKKGFAKPMDKLGNKLSVNRDEKTSVFSPGGFTDNDFDRLILESQDDEYKKYEQEEKEQEQKRRIREQIDDETRNSRFLSLRKLLEVHGFRRRDIAKVLVSNFSMRDMQILRHHGLEWSWRGPTESNVKAAIDRYDYEWRKAWGIAGASMKEWTQADQEALEKQEEKARILKAQLEGLSATTGSFLGAVSGGVARRFTDDEEAIASVAKAGAALGGVFNSFAQAKGQRGSYLPQVEKAPINPYGKWRYSGTAPTKRVNSPAVDPLAGSVPRQLDLSGNLQVSPPMAGIPSAPVAPKKGPMREPPGGGLRAGMTATPGKLTPHKRYTPSVEVLPRTTIPMSSFEPPKPGHYLVRKPPHKSIRPEILANAGHTRDGRLRDANTGRALNKFVWGHAPDFQFEPMRDLFEKLGKTQADFDAFYLDPKKWQIEYGPTNSSRRFDSVPRGRPVH